LTWESASVLTSAEFLGAAAAMMWVWVWVSVSGRVVVKGDRVVRFLN
jgi:hypothetical protein